MLKQLRQKQFNLIKDICYLESLKQILIKLAHILQP